MGTERIPVDQYQEITLSDVTVSTVFVEDEDSKPRHVECVFMPKTTDDNNVERIRVRINLQKENNQLKSPIEVTKERKTSTESSRGTIAKGGGLDARTVTTLIGKQLANKPFSERKAVDLVALEGTWTTKTSSVTKDVADVATEQRDGTFWKSALSLGGNIIVRYNTSSASPPSDTSVEISFIILDDSADAIEVPIK